MIVPDRLYEPNRLTIRTEPLIVVHGRLERHANGGGQVNLLATSLTRLSHTTGQPATVRDLPQPGKPPTADEDFNAVAPPAMNFAQGRRR